MHTQKLYIMHQKGTLITWYGVCQVLSEATNPTAFVTNPKVGATDPLDATNP